MKYTIDMGLGDTYTFNGVINATTSYFEEELTIDIKNNAYNRKMISSLKNHNGVEATELTTISGITFQELFIEPFLIRITLVDGVDDLLDSFDDDVIYYTIGADGETYERDFYVILDKEDLVLRILDEMIDVRLDIDFRLSKEEHLDKLRSIVEMEIKTLGYTITE